MSLIWNKTKGLMNQSPTKAVLVRGHLNLGRGTAWLSTLAHSLEVEGDEIPLLISFCQGRGNMQGLWSTFTQAQCGDPMWLAQPPLHPSPCVAVQCLDGVMARCRCLLNVLNGWTWGMRRVCGAWGACFLLPVQSSVCDV